MTSPSQTDLVEQHVNDAVAAGARAVVGGKRGPGPGDFFEPTLLLDVDHSMECMTEETFGPTLPVMKVADVDEAVRARQRLALRPAGLGLDQGHRARRARSPAGSSPGSSASTTRSSTTSRSSCRWAAGRSPASAPATAPAASASTRSSRPCWSRASRRRTRTSTCSRTTTSAVTKLLGRSFKLLWGRGKRD